MYLSTAIVFGFLVTIVTAEQNLQCQNPGGESGTCTGADDMINPIKIIIDSGSYDPQEIAKSRVPTLIKGDKIEHIPWPINQWTAHLRWSYDYLSRRIPKLMMNNQTVLPNSQHTEFVLRKSFIPGRHLPEIERNTELSFVESSVRSLLMRQSNKYRLYYQNALDNLENFTVPVRESARSLLSEVNPFSPLVVNDDPDILNVPGGIRPTIWLSQSRVVAQTHYDQSNNFHALLFGRKRVKLWPPNQWPNLYLFPHLSTSARQVQPSEIEPRPNLFPKYENAKGYVVDLKPMEILYIPPFWFHRVESMHASVSISIISPSKEEIDWNQVFKNSIRKFQGMSSFEERVLSMRLYLSMILNGLPGIDNAANFVQTLFETRYKAYMEVLSQSQIQDSKVKDNIDSLDDTCFWNHQGPNGQYTRQFIQEQMRANLEISAQSMIKELTKVQLDYSIRDIYLGNYVEDVAHFVVGINNVPFFLQRCFIDYSEQDPLSIDQQQQHLRDEI